MFFSGRNSGGWGSVGSDNGVTAGCLEWNGGYDANAPVFGQAGAQYVRQAAADYQSFIISSMDSDGFTLAYTKSGSPTGTLAASFIAFG